MRHEKQTYPIEKTLKGSIAHSGKTWTENPLAVMLYGTLSIPIEDLKAELELML